MLIEEETNQHVQWTLDMEALSKEQWMGNSSLWLLPTVPWLISLHCALLMVIPSVECLCYQPMLAQGGGSMIWKHLPGWNSRCRLSVGGLGIESLWEKRWKDEWCFNKLLAIGGFKIKIQIQNSNLKIMKDEEYPRKSCSEEAPCPCWLDGLPAREGRTPAKEWCVLLMMLWGGRGVRYINWQNNFSVEL